MITKSNPRLRNRIINQFEREYNNEEQKLFSKHIVMSSYEAKHILNQVLRENGI